MDFKVIYRNLRPHDDVKKSVTRAIHNSLEYLPGDLLGDLEISITEVSRKADGIGRINCALTCSRHGSVVKSHDDMVTAIVDALIEVQTKATNSDEDMQEAS